MSHVSKCLSMYVSTASTRGCTEVISFQLRIYAGADCTLVACCDSCQAQSCNFLSRGDGARGGGGRSVIMTASDAAASFRGEMRRWRRRQRFRDRERCLMTSLGCKQTWQHLLIMSIPLSLGAFVSPSPFLFLCRRFVPHVPFFCLPSRVAPSRVVSVYCSCIHSRLYHSYCPLSSPPSPVHSDAAECARANECTRHCYIITASC